MVRGVNRLKLVWLRVIDVVGTCASELASNAKLKMKEINLETRKREIMTELSLKALEMWHGGHALPEPLNEMLQEYTELEEQLSILCAQRYATVATEVVESEHEEAPDPHEAEEVLVSTIEAKSELPESTGNGASENAENTD